MFASERRVPAVFQAFYHGHPSVAPHRAVTALVISVGIAGQLHDAWFGPAQARWVNVHVSFGILLCGAVVLKFFREPWRVAAESAQVNGVVGQLSREVYLLLYVLFGVKLLASVAIYLWRGGGGGAVRLGGRADGLGGFSPDDFQIYLVYGLLALATVRVLAAVRRRHGP